MTIGCSDSKRASRSQRFLYNPAEFALVGGSRDARAAFAGAIAEALGNACVVDAAEPHDPYLMPQHALDADIVIIHSETPIEIPSLTTSDVESAHMIACWGDGAVSDNMPHFAVDQAAEVATWLRRRVEPATLNGLVLAGGRSSRMGQDKASLNYHGDAQFAHTAALLSDVCNSVFISTRPDQADAQDYGGHPLLPDRFLDFGPAGAILSAQMHAPDAAWLVCACDLPYLDAETLRHLCAERNHLKLATAFRSNYQDFPEPLCAIYEPKSVHRMLRFLGLGFNCPRKVLINSDTHVIEPIHATALDNANTPEERAAAMSQINATEESHS